MIVPMWVRIAWWFLFSVEYSRLYWVHHKRNLKHCLPIFIFIFASTGLIIDKCSKQKMNISLNYKHLEPWRYLENRKIDKTKNGENVQSLRVVVVVLVQFSLANNQYQKNVWRVIYFSTKQILCISVKCRSKRFSVFKNL